MFDFSEKCRCRQRDKQTGRHAGRQTDRRTDGQSCAADRVVPLWCQLGQRGISSPGFGRTCSRWAQMVRTASGGGEKACIKQPASPAELVYTVWERAGSEQPAYFWSGDMHRPAGRCNCCDSTPPQTRPCQPRCDFSRPPAPLLPCPGEIRQLRSADGSTHNAASPRVCWVGGSPGCVAATSWETSSSHSLSL